MYTPGGSWKFEVDEDAGADTVFGRGEVFGRSTGSGSRTRDMPIAARVRRRSSRESVAPFGGL